MSEYKGTIELAAELLEQKLIGRGETLTEALAAYTNKQIWDFLSKDAFFESHSSQIAANAVRFLKRKQENAALEVDREFIETQIREKWPKADVRIKKSGGLTRVTMLLEGIPEEPLDDGVNDGRLVAKS